MYLLNQKVNKVGFYLQAKEKLQTAGPESEPVQLQFKSSILI